MNWISAFGNKTHSFAIHTCLHAQLNPSLDAKFTQFIAIRSYSSTFIARDQWGAQIPTTSGPFMRSIRSRNSAVTRLWARRSWVLFSVGVRIPSLFQTVQTGFGGHPNSYSVGTWVSFVGGKAAGSCIWPPISISFRIKNTWSCTSAPPICPYGVHRNIFTFLPSCMLHLRMDKDDHLNEAATYEGGPHFKSGLGYWV